MLSKSISANTVHIGSRSGRSKCTGVHQPGRQAGTRVSRVSIGQQVRWAGSACLLHVNHFDSDWFYLRRRRGPVEGGTRLTRIEVKRASMRLHRRRACSLAASSCLRPTVDLETCAYSWSRLSVVLRQPNGSLAGIGVCDCERVLL